MPENYFGAKIDELLAYPEHSFGEPASERWLSLCSCLSKYQAPFSTFEIDRDRKWELVSALQKAIRRADKGTALQLISGFANMPRQYGYLWRRMCVIACEDIGPADDILAAFVVACSIVFPPKKTGRENYRLICFLAEAMCDLPRRSRVYCSYSAIEPGVINCDLPQLSRTDETIVSAIRGRLTAAQAPGSPRLAWQKKNDWRAEGLLKFVGLALPLEMHIVETPLLKHTVLFDLPAYCYDMHTRVGLQVLQRLVRGVSGAEGIKELFRETRIENAHRALGEVLFLAEGAQIKSELLYDPLRFLEERFTSYKLGIAPEKWGQLQNLPAQALAKGIVDRVREEVLHRFYGQGNLQLDCKKRRAGRQQYNKLTILLHSHNCEITKQNV